MSTPTFQSQYGIHPISNDHALRKGHLPNFNLNMTMHTSYTFPKIHVESLSAYIPNMLLQFFLKHNPSLSFMPRVFVDSRTLPKISFIDTWFFFQKWLTFFLFYPSFFFSYVSRIFLITWLHSFISYVCSSNQHDNHLLQILNRGHLIIFPLVNFPTKLKS